MKDHRRTRCFADRDHVVARRTGREHGKDLVLLAVIGGAPFEQRVGPRDNVAPDDLRFAHHLMAVSG